jgi:cytochrome c-type biogenesis protein CcmE
MSIPRRTLQILLTVAVALGGVAFLAFQSAGDVEYYVHVEDLTANPAPWLSKKTIQVHGYARRVPLHGTIQEQVVTRRFELERNGQSISVFHEGVVPDTFKEEAETVVKGNLTRQPDGTLLLTTVGGEQGIMAKCPSKYQAKGQ